MELVLVQVRRDGREVPRREGWGQQGWRRREGGRRLQGAELALQRLTLTLGRSTLFPLLQAHDRQTDRSSHSLPLFVCGCRVSADMVELCVEVSDDFLQRLDVSPEVVGRRPRPLAADEARLVGRLGGVEAARPQSHTPTPDNGDLHTHTQDVYLPPPLCALAPSFVDTH